MVDEPVDHGGSDDAVTEDLAPTAEGLVASDDQAGNRTLRGTARRLHVYEVYRHCV